MAVFSPDRMDAVLAKCRSAGEVVGGAFGAAFGSDFQTRPAEPTQVKLDDLLKNLSGGGLVLTIWVDKTRCLAVLSQADELLPHWCTEPGDESAQKLEQLGNDLVAALLPAGTESKLADATFHRVLSTAVRDSGPTSESVCLSLEIAKGDESAQLSLIWPVTSFIDPIATTVAEKKDAPEPAVAKGPPKRGRLSYHNLEDGIRQLPAYAKSLLRIRVPVTVTLATSKTPVSKVVDMVPGTILQFTKTCESKLTMEVGRQELAEGEAVKVGDKFGLLITSMTLPSERFWSVDKTAMTKRVK